ncbi:tripartite tricarboxylate transporter TctB family protein [Clostridium boliviensis]|uniref:Tripartite tricarboxylate transporter TctB family protein n=1 Tax=Clostridium boliviensis TaxID=318465 RepID=A0ABU4GNV3_9CLOT|nr:tripartite tricarboxylate transporter TctB family protein [Clostridium boliviensis]MDW2799279.1 tripartite tricarboxylate transporter TctB family protein [Clostridium boliviensis]
MFIKKYGDIIVGGFFMILSAGMMIMAKMLPKSAIMDIGPDFMPMCIGIVTFALAAVLAFLNIKNLKIRTAEAETMEKENLDYKRMLISFILILVYVYLLHPVGFIVSTILYLPLQMYILAPDDKKKKKDIIQLVIITVIFTFVVFFLFRYGFKIILPAGIFTINL